MSIRAKPRERSTSRKVTPPSPSYMDNDQFSSYLSGLRNNRVARPGGARPPPLSGVFARRGLNGMPTTAAATMTPSVTAPSLPRSSMELSDGGGGRPSLDLSVVGSVSSRYSTASGRGRHGRDYYPDRTSTAGSDRALPPPLRPDEVVPTDTYMESGQRWMEKEEAVSLRMALEDMDLVAAPTPTEPAVATTDRTSTALVTPPSPSATNDHRLYQAALDEAAELVWQHQHGVLPPEPGAPYSYKAHLRKNSYAHARTASVGRYGDDIEPTGLARDPPMRSFSGSSASSDEGAVRSSMDCSSMDRPSLDQARPTVAFTTPAAPPKGYHGLASGPRPMASASASAAKARRRSSMKRNISGEIQKPFSGDQIYEEPETATPQKETAATTDKVLRAAADNAVRPSEPPSAVSKLVSRYEIHRNPPSQSRNPQYTTNTATPPVVPEDVPRKNGVEIRSDDIREATSMKLKDRNPKLPTPSFVSDNPGRPIVSFDANWKQEAPPATAYEPATDAQLGGARQNQQNQQNQTQPQPQTQPSRPSQSAQQQPQHKPKGPLSPFSAAVRGRFRTAPAAAVTPVAGSGTPSSPLAWREPSVVAAKAPPSRPTPTVAPLTTPAPISTTAPSIAITPAPRVSAPVPSISVSVPSVSVTPAAPIPSISVSQAPSISIPPPIPTISVSEAPSTRPAPPIPTIVLPDDDANTPDIPIIVTEDTSQSHSRPLPTIITPDSHKQTSTRPLPSIVTPNENNNRSSRPLPTIVTPDSSRPLPTPDSSSSRRPLPTPGAVSRGHWSRAPSSHAGNRATALCHECGYAIEGRFVALAGRTEKGGSERFHPQCFRCHACGTSLDALEVSPEPDEARAARLARITARARGEAMEERRGQTAIDDGDARLRFFCHLDWHELYAPRCHHCTTPIVGEHVVALGHHWHVGHFFCAECGDPFGPGATHIEKDGYAWCVGCQAKRTERRAPRCRACGKAVIGSYVQALGAEWHDDCFRCGVCSGGFPDGQIFPREGKGGLMQVVCTECRQRELKA